MRNEIFAQYCTRTGVGPAQVRYRSKRIRLASAFAGILVILVGFFSFTPAARAENLAPLYAKIKAAIAGGNAAKTSWAVGKIAALLRAGDHYNCPSRLRWVWLPLLLNHRQYAAIAKLTRLQILLAPGDTVNVSDFQMYRTQALLFEGQTQKALRNAKSLFNIVPTSQVSQAVLLVNGCLRNLPGDGKSRAREFRREQIAGSQPPVPGQTPGTCAVLAGIRIHGKAYTHDLRQQVGVGTQVLIARGDLWLLADHPDKALKCFKSAYDIATPGQLPMVCDRIAAAMRAKDGTIGAANAWLKSIAR